MPLPRESLGCENMGIDASHSLFNDVANISQVQINQSNLEEEQETHQQNDGNVAEIIQIFGNEFKVQYVQSGNIEDRLAYDGIGFNYDLGDLVRVEEVCGKLYITLVLQGGCDWQDDDDDEDWEEEDVDTGNEAEDYEDGNDGGGHDVGGERPTNPGLIKDY